MVGISQRYSCSLVLDTVIQASLSVLGTVILGSVIPGLVVLRIPAPAAYRVGGALSGEHLEAVCNLGGAAPRQLLLRGSTSCILAVVRIPAPAAYRVGGALSGEHLEAVCNLGGAAPARPAPAAYRSS